MTGATRGQSNLIALGIALLFVTAAVGVAISIGSTTVPGDGDVLDRRLATDVAATLVGPDSPLTAETGVLEAAALATLDVATIRNRSDLPPTTGIRVQFQAQTLVADGSITDGHRVRRIVAVTERSWNRQTQTVQNGSTFQVTGPGPVRVGTTGNTTLASVRVDGRVIANNATGLITPLSVAVPPDQPVRIAVTVTESRTSDTVWVASPVIDTEPGVLVVTVDA